MTLPLHRHALRASAESTAPSSRALFTVPLEYVDAIAGLCLPDGDDARRRGFAWSDEMDDCVCRLLDFIGWAVAPDRPRVTGVVSIVDGPCQLTTVFLAVVPLGGAIVLDTPDMTANRIAAGEGVVFDDEQSLAGVSIRPESASPLPCLFVRAFDRP
jgi:hypothetical protein